MSFERVKKKKKRKEGRKKFLMLSTNVRVPNVHNLENEK